jgi:hypothetical protein
MVGLDQQLASGGSKLRLPAVGEPVDPLGRIHHGGGSHPTPAGKSEQLIDGGL